MRMIFTTGLGLVLVALGGIAPAPARAGGQDAICASQLLSYNERSLCKEQIATANTKTERKQIQEKYRGRVKAREEDAKKDK